MDKVSEQKPKHEETDLLDDILGDGSSMNYLKGAQLTEKQSTSNESDIEDDLDNLLSGTVTKSDKKKVIPSENLSSTVATGVASSKDLFRESEARKTIDGGNKVKTNKEHKYLEQKEPNVNKLEKNKSVKSSNLEDELEGLLNLDTPVSASSKPAAVNQTNDGKSFQIEMLQYCSLQS